MPLDKATINDYVKDLTVVSPSRDRKRINFELTLQTSDDEKRVVRFNPKNQKKDEFFCSAIRCQQLHGISRIVKASVNCTP